MKTFLISLILLTNNLRLFSQEIFNPIYNWKNTSDSILSNKIEDSIFLPLTGKFHKNNFLFLNSTFILDDNKIANCNSYLPEYKIRELVVRKNGGRWYALYHIIYDSLVLFYSPLDKNFKLNGISIIRRVNGYAFDCNKSIYNKGELVDFLSEIKILSSFILENISNELEIMLFKNGIRDKDFSLVFNKPNLGHTLYDMPYLLMDLRLKKKRYKLGANIIND